MARRRGFHPFLHNHATAFESPRNFFPFSDEFINIDVLLLLFLLELVLSVVLLIVTLLLLLLRLLLLGARVAGLGVVLGLGFASGDVGVGAVGGVAVLVVGLLVVDGLRVLLLGLLPGGAVVGSDGEAALGALAAAAQVLGQMGLAAGQVDVDAAGVVFGAELQAQIAANLLAARLELLDVAGRVVAFADDDVQVRLAVLLGVADALLEDVLGLLDELAVQVQLVAGHAVLGVVLAEDEFGGLLVVFVHLRGVLLARLGEFVGFRAVAGLVGLVRAVEAVLALLALVAGEVAQAVILVLDVFGALVIFVVESCGDGISGDVVRARGARSKTHGECPCRNIRTPSWKWSSDREEARECRPRGQWLWGGRTGQGGSSGT